LGAEQGDIVRLVVSHGLKLAVTGLAVGIPGAFALTHVMSSLLLDVVPLDLATNLGFALLLLVVPTVSSCLPAVRATKADPMEAFAIEMVELG